MIMAMTVSEMKRDAVNLIYQVDDKNTEKMEKILLFLKASVSEINNDTMYDRQRKERVAKVKKYAGIFASCKDDDYKTVKEQYLSDKYKWLWKYLLTLMSF